VARIFGQHAVDEFHRALQLFAAALPVGVAAAIGPFAGPAATTPPTRLGRQQEQHLGAFEPSAGRRRRRSTCASSTSAAAVSRRTSRCSNPAKRSSAWAYAAAARVRSAGPPSRARIAPTRRHARAVSSCSDWLPEFCAANWS
jgi:hypothetical protein